LKTNLRSPDRRLIEPINEYTDLDAWIGINPLTS
jgi:hypothetical protein